MSDDEYNEFEFKSYHLRIESFGPLHITKSTCYGKTCAILWNQFCIGLYEIDQLPTVPSVYYSNDLILNVQATQNILLLSDATNSLYCTLLWNPESAEKNLLTGIIFKRIFADILTFLIDNDEIITIQKCDGENWINVYSIIENTKFKFNKKFRMSVDCISGVSTLMELKLYMKSIKYFTALFADCVLNIKDDYEDFEARLLFVLKDDTVYVKHLGTLKKDIVSILHSSPVPIREIGFNTKPCSTMYLALVTGSITILTPDLNNVHIETVHLNCSIERIIFANNYFLYSDGEKTWQSMVDRSPEDKTILQQRELKVKFAFDFIFIESVNVINCITLNNILYVFECESDECFTSFCISCECKYIKVPKSLKETQRIFNEIIEENKRNEIALNKIVKEKSLITIIALKQNPELMLNHLFSSVEFYDDVKDLNFRSDNIMLITELENYYKENSYVYVVKYETSKDFRSRFKGILKNSPGIWHLNIKLKCNEETFTTCIGINDCDDLKIAIPIDKKSMILPATLDVKLIGMVPSVFNEDVHLWCLLPTKPIMLSIKYFFKTPTEINILKRGISKKEILTVDEQIVETSQKLNKTYEIKNTKEKCKDLPTFSYFIPVPDVYENYSKGFVQNFVCRLNVNSAREISNKLNDKMFHTNGRSFKIRILYDTIDIGLVSVDSNQKKIKLTSIDNEICWEMFNFIRDNIKPHLDSGDYKSILHFDYMRLQKIREVTSNILNIDKYDSENKKTLMNLNEEFKSDIIGILPL